MPPVPVGGCFFVIWLVMMIGMIAGWILFLVAVWRMSKAHEQIAQTLSLGIALLGQRPKSPPAQLTE